MTDRGPLPPKLYYRIGEVATLIGVETHVIRYWEREFRSIRPGKSAKGQRVYSRQHVENLLRIRELLYGQGFTIAGARRKMRDKDEPDDLEESGPSTQREVAGAPAFKTDPAPAMRGMSTHVRSELESLRAEIVTLLEELGGSP